MSRWATLVLFVLSIPLSLYIFLSFLFLISLFLYLFFPLILFFIFSYFLFLSFLHLSFTTSLFLSVPLYLSFPSFLSSSPSVFLYFSLSFSSPLPPSSFFFSLSISLALYLLQSITATGVLCLHFGNFSRSFLKYSRCDILIRAKSEANDVRLWIAREYQNTCIS